MTDKDPTETWLWERARDMLEQADRIQRSFFAPQRPGARRPSWEPPADVFENATEVLVIVALPGVTPASVCVELLGSEVLVRGERAQPANFRSATVHRLEIPHGRFERRVGVPPGTRGIERQELVDGCLFLCLSKAP